jgi:hypothetical protein
MENTLSFTPAAAVALGQHEWPSQVYVGFSDDVVPSPFESSCAIRFGTCACLGLCKIGLSGGSLLCGGSSLLSVFADMAILSKLKYFCS